MAEGSDSKGEGFVHRWSRLKLGEVEEPTTAMMDEAAAASEPTLGSKQDVAEAPDQPTPIPDDLPPIEDLDNDSDYSLFMREGTPVDLQRLALKKLWHSDPVFAALDGLNDYDDDYSLIGMVAEEISSHFKPGEALVKSKIEPETETEHEPETDSNQEEAEQDSLEDETPMADGEVPVEEHETYPAAGEPVVGKDT